MKPEETEKITQFLLTLILAVAYFVLCVVLVVLVYEPDLHHPFGVS